MFSQTDLAQIKELGIEISEIENQLENFKSGFPFADIQAPATVGDGILRLENDKLQEAVANYEKSLSGKDILKFVPASGAASRMFKHLFAFMKKYDGSEKAYEKFTSDTDFNSVYNFFKKLNDFAFYEDLKKTFGDGNELEEAHLKKEYVKILSNLLNEEGLDYGNLPKGLLKFHTYKYGSRTPLEEHLVEGAEYAKGKGNSCQTPLHGFARTSGEICRKSERSAERIRKNVRCEIRDFLLRAEKIYRHNCRGYGKQTFSRTRQFHPFPTGRTRSFAF